LIFHVLPSDGRWGWGNTRDGFTPTQPSPIEGEEICWLNTSINHLPLLATLVGEGRGKGDSRVSACSLTLPLSQKERECVMTLMEGASTGEDNPYLSPPLN
jgi:hypothetical protein